MYPTGILPFSFAHHLNIYSIESSWVEGCLFRRTWSGTMACHAQKVSSHHLTHHNIGSSWHLSRSSHPTKLTEPQQQVTQQGVSHVGGSFSMLYDFPGFGYLQLILTHIWDRSMLVTIDCNQENLEMGLTDCLVCKALAMSILSVMCIVKSGEIL